MPIFKTFTIGPCYSFGCPAVFTTASCSVLRFSGIPDDVITTRDTKYKLIQHHCCCDLRKFNFTNRVMPIWNSLSNYVVSADTVNSFKNRLDKFWSNQEALYNHKADLHGTGNRSISE